MGKKRIIKKSGGPSANAQRALARVPKVKVAAGTFNVNATFNNTIVALCDQKGNLVLQASAGAIGFSGSRKSTPFAATKVGELLAEKAAQMGMKEAKVVIKGVGPGRESALRGFITKGIVITSITDVTPVPHNGPRPKKPRRI
ncbi:30S ribosomal protein S11 [Candidatus Kaiserbacteria bacterium RIFCSPHIGHO2_02_FULL_49_34]|uniref:Small ribosomal subunit protein uS11 n=1 Tax=Candidatus Kaiserbacteria bacterium RIFCSPHIGHO2_02_FULL_49_34 TaxID=1798491 RepID=A0A1F6DI17_9BACT|nr:MAG: 30S ribosomal protein S11 [Candidatus Kaiserbacteria bacterium RIFCSPHIGHO2_02_FULL_49_34]